LDTFRVLPNKLGVRELRTLLVEEEKELRLEGMAGEEK